MAPLDAPVRVGRRGWALVWGLLVLLLLPTLLLPLGGDQGLFMTAGRMILEGKVHYRDIVDIKPPLIYHYYALAAALPGSAAVDLRVIDMLLQLLSCWILIRLVRLGTGDDRIAAATAVIYVIAYLGGGLASTAQTESYVALLGGGAALLWLRQRGSPEAAIGRMLLVGALVGILTLLKFTLGVVLLPLLLLELVAARAVVRTRLVRSAAMLAGMLAIVALLPLYLTLGDAWGGFQEMNRFISTYARIEWKGLGPSLKHVMTMVPHHLGIDYSLLLVVATVVGGAAALGLTRWQSRALLLRLSLLMFLLLLLTVVIEGKYLLWHISRIYAFGAVMSAAGLVGILDRIRSRWGEIRAEPLRLVVGGGLLVTLLLFSPLSPYLWRTVGPAFKSLQRMAGGEQTEGLSTRDADVIEAIEMADYIRPRLKAGEEVMSLSARSGVLYNLLDHVPKYRILHSAFLLAPFGPPSWQRYTVDHILHEHPAFIVVQRSDSLPGLSGSRMSSKDWVRSRPAVDSVLRSEYRLVHAYIEHDLYELRDRGRRAR